MQGRCAISLDSAHVLLGPKKAFPPEDGSRGAPQSSAVTRCPGLNPFPHRLRRGRWVRLRGDFLIDRLVICHHTLKKTLEVRS